MEKKNPHPAKKAPLKENFCMGLEKDRDAVFNLLSREILMSSEEEENIDDDDFMNERLDQIQGVDMDHDLYEILSDNQTDTYEINEQITTHGCRHPANTFAANAVDDQFLPLDIQSPTPDNQQQFQSLVSNEQVSTFTRDLLDSPPPPTVDNQLPTHDSIPTSSRNEFPTARRTRPSYAQLQNRRWEWTTDIDDYEGPTFDKAIKIKNVYNNRSQPKQYFMSMCPDEAIEKIVENTNIYAHFERSKNWVDVTHNEMNAFLGIIILMSVNPMNDYQLYWSTDPFYNNPVISKIMTLKRFKKILENLHVNNRREELPRSSPDYNKLCKVQPFIDILNKTFEEACEPSATQSIDESMIRFKGRSSMRQYMPMKPIKRGYKCWARCDSKTGYLHQFQLYTGKTGTTTEENLGYRVVLDLSENVPANTLLAFDNYFTSLGLLLALHQQQILAVATMRSTRKGLPNDLTKKTKSSQLAPGEFTFWYSKPIALIKWRDSKDVFVATTAYSPREITTVNRKQKDGTRKELFCPLAIKKYTQYMGGVDLFDHYRSSYPLGRKSKKNWHRLFWFLFDAAIINAYIVYMQGHSERRNTHREFRMRLGRALIDNYSNKKKAIPVFKSKKGGIYGVPDEIRLSNVGLHMPEIANFRRCRFCSTRATEKRSKYVCTTCKIPLCAAPCFATFHDNLYQ